MITLLFIMALLWICAWLALFLVGVLALMAVIKLYDYVCRLIDRYRSWRIARATDAVAVREAQRRRGGGGWLAHVLTTRISHE